MVRVAQEGKKSHRWAFQAITMALATLSRWGCGDVACTYEYKQPRLLSRPPAPCYASDATC